MHHRHFIFTIPVSLRQLFLRERRLLGLLPRCAFETIRRTFTAVLGQEEARPGMVVAIQTFGSQLRWDPHRVVRVWAAAENAEIPRGGVKHRAVIDSGARGWQQTVVRIVKTMRKKGGGSPRGPAGTGMFRPSATSCRAET